MDGGKNSIVRNLIGHNTNRTKGEDADNGYMMKRKEKK